MARIRTIKPDFFRHERLFEAERSTGLPLRIAFAGLWTAADREGRFKWTPRQLKLDCLPYDDVDFNDVLIALEKHDFIVSYEVENSRYGFIPSWLTHQHINTREAQSTLPDPSCARTCTHVIARGEGKGKEGKEKDAASAATIEKITPEAELFDRGKRVLGPAAGGLIAKLLASKDRNVALARAVIETASTKENPREYVGAIVRGNHDPPSNPNGALI